MRALILLAAIAAPGLAGAQIVNPVDLSQVASKSDMQTVQASICPAGSTTPQAEIVAGSAGTASTCLRSDAKLPRITRAGMVTTDASGNWSVTWSTPLAAPPATLPIPMLPSGGTQPIVCAPTTSTATGSAGRCFYSRTLPATITLLSNLVSYDVFGAAASNITVQVFAIPTTQ